MAPITSQRSAALSIGQLSRVAGVHIETIRYYERIGMLPTPPRTAAGRRVYGSDHARALTFVRRGRELGFTLEEIRALLELNRANPAPCAEVRKIAGLHLQSVRAKLADLAVLESILAQTVTRCEGNISAECAVLDMLGR